MRRIFILAACISVTLFGMEIDRQRGYWKGLDACKHHKMDWKLAEAVAVLLKKEKAESVYDFGCGMGMYTKYLLDKGFQCRGFDGNPKTPVLTQGIGEVKDLSKPFDLEEKCDWLVCLEVGEHIPKTFEKVLVENIVRHASKGIILSWAIKGQGGDGHFNCQNNDYVKEMMSQYGFNNDLKAEKYLRTHCSLRWFPKSLMVFRRAE